MGEIQGDRYYVRDLQTVVVGARDTFHLSRGDDRSTVTDVAAPAFSQLLQRLAAPMVGHDLLGALDGELAATKPALEALLDNGMMLEAADPGPLVAARDELFGTTPGYCFAARPQRCEQMVLGLTGSVISGLMAPFVFSLAYSGFFKRLEAIVTPAARNFVQPELFEYYGIRTWTDPFGRREGIPVPHILLAKATDLLLVMPASAHSIARIASGACSDLLSLVVAATSAPVVIAPCMNTAMWDDPAVRRNVDQVRADGHYVIEPTLFFEAAELIHGAPPGYGMPGVFWGGPVGLMDALGMILDVHAPT